VLGFSLSLIVSQFSNKIVDRSKKNGKEKEKKKSKDTHIQIDVPVRYVLYFCAGTTRVLST
jgi:hypothetical protein